MTTTSSQARKRQCCKWSTAARPGVRANPMHSRSSSQPLRSPPPPPLKRVVKEEAELRAEDNRRVAWCHPSMLAHPHGLVASTPLHADQRAPLLPPTCPTSFASLPLSLSHPSPKGHCFFSFVPSLLPFLPHQSTPIPVFLQSIHRLCLSLCPQCLLNPRSTTLPALPPLLALLPALSSRLRTPLG